MRSPAGWQRIVIGAAVMLLATPASFADAPVVFAVVPLTPAVNPYHLAPDFNGGVWCTDRQHGTVDHLVGDVNGDGVPDIIVIPPTDSGTLAIPESIATAPNGNVVFTFNTTSLDGTPIDSRVGFFNAADPTHVNFVQMPPTAGVAGPQDTCANADCPLALTRDGTEAWVVEQNVDRVARVGLNRPAIQVFSLSPHSFPLAVATAPDGSAFVAEFFGGQAGRIAQVSASGQVVETLFPAFPAGDKPQRLAFNLGDGLLYIGTSADGLVTMSPAHQFARTALPTSNTSIASVTEGRDGDIWWTGFLSKTVGQYVPPAGPMNLTQLADGPSDLAFSGAALYYVGFAPGTFDGTLHKGALPSRPRPRIKEVKTHSSDVVPAGSGHVRITYTITMTNIGEDATHGPLFIFDHVPLGDVVDAPPACSVQDAVGEPAALLTCQVPTQLLQGESTTVTFTAEVPIPARGEAVRNICAYSGGGAGLGTSNYDVYLPPASRSRPARHP